MLLVKMLDCSKGGGRPSNVGEEATQPRVILLGEAGDSLLTSLSNNRLTCEISWKDLEANQGPALIECQRKGWKMLP